MENRGFFLINILGMDDEKVKVGLWRMISVLNLFNERHPFNSFMQFPSTDLSRSRTLSFVD